MSELTCAFILFCLKVAEQYNSSDLEDYLYCSSNKLNHFLLIPEYCSVFHLMWCTLAGEPYLHSVYTCQCISKLCNSVKSNTCVGSTNMRCTLRTKLQDFRSLYSLAMKYNGWGRHSEGMYFVVKFDYAQNLSCSLRNLCLETFELKLTAEVRTFLRVWHNNPNKPN